MGPTIGGERMQAAVSYKAALSVSLGVPMSE